MKLRISARMTPAQIDGIKPGPKRLLVSDEAVANLFLRIEPGGTKAWVYDAAPLPDGDKRIKDTLGRWPRLGLADARELARQHNVSRRSGIDPRVRKAQAAAAELVAKANTLDAVFAQWIAHKRRVGEALRTLSGYEKAYWANVRPLYGDKPIAEFDKAAVRECVRVMHERGSVGAANGLLTVLGTFLRWCIVEDYFESHGALSLPKSGKRGPGARALSVPELALCWRAAAYLSEKECDALRLLILTGLRKSEVFAAHASEYKDGIWTIPVSRMKSAREHVMPMPEWGRQIFEKRMRTRPGHLFGDNIYPMMMAKLPIRASAAMTTLSGEAIPHWSLHSIRKGVRSALTSDEMFDMGEVFSESIAEIVIAHSLGSLNRTYNKSKYARQIGSALNAWEKLLRLSIAKQENTRRLDYLF